MVWRRTGLDIYNIFKMIRNSSASNTTGKIGKQVRHTFRNVTGYNGEAVDVLKWNFRVVEKLIFRDVHKCSFQLQHNRKMPFVRWASAGYSLKCFKDFSSKVNRDCSTILYLKIICTYIYRNSGFYIRDRYIGVRYDISHKWK